jgi:hypothetical protein
MHGTFSVRHGIKVVRIRGMVSKVICTQGLSTQGSLILKVLQTLGMTLKDTPNVRYDYKRYLKLQVYLQRYLKLKYTIT